MPIKRLTYFLWTCLISPINYASSSSTSRSIPPPLSSKLPNQRSHAPQRCSRQLTMISIEKRILSTASTAALCPSDSSRLISRCFTLLFWTFPSSRSGQGLASLSKTSSPPPSIVSILSIRIRKVCFWRRDFC